MGMDNGTVGHWCLAFHRDPKSNGPKTYCNAIGYCAYFATDHEYFNNRGGGASYWHLVYITLASPEVESG
jgi:hypothetical protein